MKYTHYLAITILFISCGMDKPECTNTNNVLAEHDVTDREYRDELVKLLNEAEKDKIGMWIQSYEQQGDKEFMYVDVVSKNICAVAQMDITNSTDLDSYKSSEGKSYNGALLINPKYRIIDTDSGKAFVMDSPGSIFD